MDNRQRLIEIANGNRPGYWIEILRQADTGAVCYGLHRPARRNAKDAAAGMDRLAVQLPYTWEGLRIIAAKYLGREDAADTLDQHDDGRTTTGKPIDRLEAEAYAKHIKV